MGFANGAFEESDDDVADVVEEFFPEQDVAVGSQPSDSDRKVPPAKTAGNAGLREKLERKAVAMTN